MPNPSYCMYSSVQKRKSKGKGEFFIIGSLEEIRNLAESQKRYVGDKYDINGAIACVCVEEIAKYSRNYDHFVTGIDHNGLKKKFKCGSQCKWLWTGSKKRPYCWQDTICNIFKTSDLSKFYVLSVFFKNGTSIFDGNPFIGGTQDKNEPLIQTAHRELFEEVGLVVNSHAKIRELPTVSRDKCIWLVEAKDVFDAKKNPLCK